MAAVKVKCCGFDLFVGPGVSIYAKLFKKGLAGAGNKLAQPLCLGRGSVVGVTNAFVPVRLCLNNLGKIFRAAHTIRQPAPYTNEIVFSHFSFQVRTPLANQSPVFLWHARRNTTGFRSKLIYLFLLLDYLLA